jgi:hypothetical protein
MSIESPNVYTNLKGRDVLFDTLAKIFRIYYMILYLEYNIGA